MAATGKTPILLYGSTTATNTPSAGNLTNSSDGCEIAINVADKNLFFKDSTNAVNTVPIRQSSASSDGWLSSTDWTTFNNKSPAAGSSSITTVGTITSGTWNGSTIDVAHGGTGRTAFGAGAVIYGNGSSALSASSNLYFNGTQLSVGTSTPTATLTVATTTGFSFSNPSSAGTEFGTRGTGAGYIFNTPSLNSTFTSGLAVYGSYASQVSTVNLTATGVYSAGGYYSKISLSTANGQTITEQVNINGSTGNVTVNTGNLVIGTSGKGIDFSATSAGIIWRTGVGSPEGVVTAAVGSLYTRSDGGVGTTLYVKQSGTGNTGWAAK